mgnify:CR=1 FL=1
MKRPHRLALLIATALLLSACQDPTANPLTGPRPNQWDASVWDNAQWE